MGVLDGKIALVTGASRGIGRGIALAYAGEGASVAFTYLSSDTKARQLEAELETLGVKAKGYKSDAGSFEAAEKLIDEIVADFGTLDIVVNNAGITRDTLLMRMTEAQWDDVIQTNLKSVFNICRFAIKPMLKAKSGSIINVSSVVGVNGNAGQSNYASSKAGVIAFTKSLAKELGSRNIRCNAIAPGYIETDMTDEVSDAVKEEYKKAIPLRRTGTKQDVAGLALFLASPWSSYVTGQTIHVDGGLLT